MSLLSHNRLTIVLTPGRVALLSHGRRMTLRGVQHTVLDREHVASVAEGEMPWSGALQALGAALPRFARQDIQASVILANHFVDYTLVPWCDNLSDEDEIAHARHCFRQLYGDAAEGWEVRVSPNSTGAPALASAVDARLLEELRTLMHDARLGIESIQPHLMVAFNSCRDSLAGLDAWFALLEPGNLCLSIIQDGQFSWMRKMRIGKAWREELPRHLEREAYLAQGATAISDVLLWAPQHEDGDIPRHARWNIRHVRPGPKSGGLGVFDGLRKGGTE